MVGVEFRCIFLSIKLLERNFEQFDVNLPWQFYDVLISFKIAAFVDFEAVTSQIPNLLPEEVQSFACRQIIDLHKL